MNDIQKDYLIGLIIRKIEKYDLKSIMDFNVEVQEYVQNIEKFIDNYADDVILLDGIYNFLISDLVEFENENIYIEKSDSFIIVKDKERIFVLNSSDFINLIISMKCYFQDYLPLGSIVKIANDGNLYVIEQRMINLKGRNYYHDYRAIPYPTGVFNDKMYQYFSSKDIDKIEFFGYSDFENEGYELALKESYLDNDIFEYTYQSILNKK